MSARLRNWLRPFQGIHTPGVTGHHKLRLAAELSDGELVFQFATTHDDDAFAELVRRHGPMVLATCRRILHPDVHTADDAFQAAFLVLSMKAGTVRPPERVGAWMYGVAVRVAKKARARAHKIVPTTSADLATVPSTTADADSNAIGLRAAIDDALAGLPTKYSAAVVLCELEGKSRAKAAQALGCSEGTLSSRLARARRLLADRLARRGFALPASGLGVVLLAQPGTARVSLELAASTIRAASLVAAGVGAEEVIPESVTALARGGHSSPTPSFQVLAAGVAGIGLILGGG